MLSLFPQLFAYAQWAPFLLRVTVAFLVIGFSYPKLLRPREYLNFILGLVEFSGSVFLIAGFLTQLAASIVILAMIIEIIRIKKAREKVSQTHFLLLVCLLSLMLLGPGRFSIDLPL